MSEAPIFREIIGDCSNVSQSDLDLIIRGGGASTGEALVPLTLVLGLAVTTFQLFCPQTTVNQA